MSHDDLHWADHIHCAIDRAERATKKETHAAFIRALIVRFDDDGLSGMADRLTRLLKSGACTHCGGADCTAAAWKAAHPNALACCPDCSHRSIGIARVPTSVSPTELPPLAQQIGGAHYKALVIQPVEYIHANGIGFCEGNSIKYLSRWRDKGGIEDLKKAKHFIELLIELESNAHKTKRGEE